MRIAIYGAAGSMGRRHAANLKGLRPEVEIVAIDPALTPALSPREMEADAAIIATPYETHLGLMIDLCYQRTPFYVEKPPVARGQLGQYADIVEVTERLELRCAVGFQYRWHKRLDFGEWQMAKFYAQDDLAARYGPTCLETMASHPIDSALHVFGPAREVQMETDGLSTSGWMVHENWKRSEFELHLDRGPRVSQICGESDLIDLTPDEGMYVDALRGWLEWLETGRRDRRTATLGEGFEVMWVLEQVKVGKVPAPSMWFVTK